MVEVEGDAASLGVDEYKLANVHPIDPRHLRAPDQFDRPRARSQQAFVKDPALRVIYTQVRRVQPILLGDRP